jgi:hypothetical protein
VLDHRDLEEVRVLDAVHLHRDQGAQTVAMAQCVDGLVKCAYDRGLLEQDQDIKPFVTEVPRWMEPR